MHRILLRALGVFLTIHAARATIAWACSCASPYRSDTDTGWVDDVDESTRLADGWEDSDLVVFAEVLGSRRAMGCESGGVARKTRFEVIDAYKGAEAGETLTLRHGTSDGTCGVEFSDGDRYVLFSNGDDISSCSSLLVTADEESDIRALMERTFSAR